MRSVEVARTRQVVIAALLLVVLGGIGAVQAAMSGASFMHDLEIVEPPLARIEPSIAEANSTDVIQFERQGYFVRDGDSTPDRPVFNRTIGLRDTFAKEVGGKG